MPAIFVFVDAISKEPFGFFHSVISVKAGYLSVFRLRLEWPCKSCTALVKLIKPPSTAGTASYFAHNTQLVVEALKYKLYHVAKDLLKP